MAAPAHAPNAMACPRCGAPAVWHAQVGQWGCDHCRQMITPVPAAQSPAQATPFCPTCWSPGTWHAQVQQWGCDRCQRPLAAAPPGAPVVPVSTRPNPVDTAGAKFGRFMLILLTIVVLVIIKVAIRQGF